MTSGRGRAPTTLFGRQDIRPPVARTPQGTAGRIGKALKKPYSHLSIMTRHRDHEYTRTLEHASLGSSTKADARIRHSRQASIRRGEKTPSLAGLHMFTPFIPVAGVTARCPAKQNGAMILVGLSAAHVYTPGWRGQTHSVYAPFQAGNNLLSCESSNRCPNRVQAKSDSFGRIAT